FFLSSFFFQAEDGIRDFHVTGVQTCALPISALVAEVRSPKQVDAKIPVVSGADLLERPNVFLFILDKYSGSRSLAEYYGYDNSRSEERRVGKECRYRWSPDH